MAFPKTFRRAAPLIAATLCLALAIVGPAWAQVGSARYSAIVMDARSGRVIMGVNQDEPRYPASLTKLMTLYMTFEALRDRRIALNYYVPVSVWASEQAPSKLGLTPGEAITVDQAIRGLVTKSANDAAAALGELLGGSEDRFAQMMTLRAHGLGMSRSRFRNASGLPDPNQWTTARDLATLGRRLVLDFPQLYGYFAVQEFVWHGRAIPNHDTMLRFYPGADGMKTGFTDLAGHNLVSSAVRGDTRLIGVVMGAASNNERDLHMAALLDDGFGRTAPAPFQFASLFGFANAASLLGSTRTEPPRSVLSGRIARDRGVQFDGLPYERAAWDLSQDAARLAPSGQPRVQPVLYGRRTLFHAQLLGLSQTEARAVCAGVRRPGGTCQVFRPGPGTLASR